MNANPLIQMRINGADVAAHVAPLTTLAELLRQSGCTGVRLGCEEGICGSCSVLVNGRSVRSCLTVAAQMDGVSVTTVEGFDSDPALRAIQDSLIAHFGAQCGFCTSGMLAVIAEYLADPMVPDHAEEAAIRTRLNAVVCRCTGYQQIVAAVRSLAMRQAADPHGE